MAVGAEQCALRRLGPHDLDRLGQAALGQADSLTLSMVGLIDATKFGRASLLAIARALMGKQAFASTRYDAPAGR